MTDERRRALGDVLGALQCGKISSAEALERLLVALIADASDPVRELVISWKDYPDAA